MAQYLRPNGDVAVGTWVGTPTSSGIYQNIDESSASDTDYIYTTGTGSIYKASLSNPSTPGSGNHVLRIRARAATATPGRTLTWTLREGATNITSQSSTLTNSIQTFTYTLTSGEVSSITNYDDLEIWIDVSGGGSNTSVVSWFEMEIPDAGVVATLSKTLDDISKTLAAKVQVSGALSKTLDGVGLSSAGGVTVTGTLSGTLEGVGLSTAGGVTVTGTLSGTLEGVGISAEGTVADTVFLGELSATLEGLGIDATGTVSVVGTLSGTLEGVGISAEGALTDVSGVLSVELDSISSNALGRVRAAVNVRAPVYILEIDWDNDDTWEQQEDRVLSMSVRRGRERMANGGGPEHMRAGTMMAMLDNFDQRYDPYNGESDLYGKVLPGRAARVRVKLGGVEYEVWRGWLTDIRPQAGSDKVVMQGVDGLQFLRVQACDWTDLESDIGVSSAINALAIMSDWPLVSSGEVFPAEFDMTLGSTSIENNGDTIEYWWATPDETILEAMERVADAFWGVVYITATGELAYKARDFNRDARLALTQEMLLREIEVKMPWDEIFNTLSVAAYPTASYAAVELWRLSAKPFIGAGDTLTIYATFRYEGSKCAATTVTSPVATTDVLANTQADGSGTNKTAQISLSMTTYGGGALLEITNNDAAGVYLTLCKLRGTALAALSATLVTEEDSTSQTAYGKRWLNVRNLWVQDLDHAQYLAAYMGLFLPYAKRSMRVRLEDRAAQQFGVDLMDTVAVKVDKLGIDGDYLVGGIEHRWEAGRAGTLTTLWLEPGLSEYANLQSFPATFDMTLGW